MFKGIKASVKVFLWRVEVVLRRNSNFFNVLYIRFIHKIVFFRGEKLIIQCITHVNSFLGAKKIPQKIWGMRQRFPAPKRFRVKDFAKKIVMHFAQFYNIFYVWASWWNCAKHRGMRKIVFLPFPKSFGLVCPWSRSTTHVPD